MSDAATAPSTLPVALLYGDADACVHLRTALAEFNANVVYDSAGSELDRAALAESGARVAVVNLDDVLDASLDEVYAVLDACGCAVVFNDPANSVALDGWGYARWLRHLAAKLRDDTNVDPPRPAGAEPVDVAEAAQLSDQWLDDALGVLGSDADESAVVAGEPEPGAGVDVGGVEIPADDVDADADAVPEFSVELEPTDTEPTAADTPDDGIAVPDTPADDSTAQLELERPLDARLASDADAIAETAPPAIAADSPESHDDSSIDDTPTAAGPSADGSPLADTDLQVDELSIDWSLLDDDNEPPAETPASDTEPVAEGLDTILDGAQLPVEDAPADLDLHAGDVSAAVPDTERDASADYQLPPSSQWELVDDTVDAPDDAAASGTGDEEPGSTRIPGQTVAESLADRDFGIELVDPIDYLAPESPVEPRETELYTAPEMMSMADALAPQQIDENIHAEAVAEPLPRVVVMAASIGGPDAVREFLAGLPAGFPAVFVLTQHMGTEFIDLMVKQLGKFSGLPVRVPASGERASTGDVLVVPNGAQLTMSRKGAIEMTSVADADAQEPSIAATLGMMAKAFEADTLAIIFSGMVADVVAGAGAVVEHGGSVWTQDPASCVVSSMVDSVTEAGMVNFSASPAQLAQHLTEQFAKESAP